MKNSKQCPKCQSREIVRVNGSVGAYGSGNNIRLGMTSYSAVEIHHYICLECGYSEEWIDQEDLWKIKNNKRAKKI